MNLADRDYDREEAKARWRAAMGIRRPSRVRKGMVLVTLVLAACGALATAGPEHVLHGIARFLSDLE